MFTAQGLLDEIAEIGRDRERGGYSRHVFDASELALRGWFTEKAESLGLTVSVDSNANLWAWWGAPGPTAVVTGSHLDSVPGGGAYDGPLGVVSALAAVSRMRAAGEQPTTPFAIVVFAEEEGSRFGVACLGSRLLTGAIPASHARQLSDRTGARLADTFEANGVDSSQIGRDDETLARIGCFVELHVEQGRDLVDRGSPIALATSILAHGRWRLRFTGEGNHAGTTPMDDRRDPVVAAARAILAIRHQAEQSDGGRATVGRIAIVPGGTNVIASVAELWLDVRADGEPAVRAMVESISIDCFDAALAEDCTFEITEESFAPQVDFDLPLLDRLSGALGDPPRIPTGAGHDAGALADLVPTAMIFVRNPTGVSHAPSEGATAEDCERGVDALYLALRELT